MNNLPETALRYVPKVTVIGAGNVGSSLAKRLLDTHLANVVLLDVVAGRPQGIALDLTEASGLEMRPQQIIGTNHYGDTADSDVVVVTAGKPRQPGMSRDDLMQVNGQIVVETIKQAIAYSPQAKFVIVTNPLDVMTYLAWQTSGLPAEQVIGMAGILDSARFRTFIAMELNVPPEDVSALVLGGHGDLMVPLPNYASVNGIPLTELLNAPTLDRLVERTRNGGAEIVNLLKTGGAYYAPAASIYWMVEAILMNRHRILPAATYLTGQYGLHDVYIGVPCRIGQQGVESVLELTLSSEQQAALAQSAAAIQANIRKITQTLIEPAQLAMTV
ncbi:MAG: malate dehydrogenase [Leptolyngbya sp. SIOISBB]|nr:malate dehydrogenase [Leptolyngbya sp. SIOISBB]